MSGDWELCPENEPVYEYQYIVVASIESGTWYASKTLEEAQKTLSWTSQLNPNWKIRVRRRLARPSQACPVASEPATRLNEYGF